MRVTGGIARGRRLKSPRQGTRPTSDLVRAAIFDVIEARGYRISPAVDLYAGSGALGIEALSRGAETCDFVERDAKNAAIVAENLRATGLDGKGDIINSSVRDAGGRLRGEYALVLADPPYDDRDAPQEILQAVKAVKLAPDVTLVLESSSRGTAPAAIGDLASIWERRYGDTNISMYRGRKEEEA